MVVGVVGITGAARRLQLRVGLDRRRGGCVPVEPAGVVRPEAQPRPAGRVGEGGHQIAAGAAGDRVSRGGARRVPECDAVVVLRGGDHVSRARGREHLDQSVGVELVCRPAIEEVVVRASAVSLPVVRGRRAARDADGVRVPLRVRVVPVPPRLVDRPQGADGLGPGRYGIGAPVHEDSELRVTEPLRRHPSEALVLVGSFDLLRHAVLLCRPHREADSDRCYR